MILINSEEQFQQEVLQADKPVMVDFYADWCGPCKAMAPLMDELDRDSDGYSVGKVNVDKLPELAARYRIVSIPAILVFKDGTCTDRCFGVSDRAELEAML